MPKSPELLNEEYHSYLGKFERRAARAKRFYQWAGIAAILATFITLGFAILGLAKAWPGRTVVEGAISISTWLWTGSLLVTLYSWRKSWVANRMAAEGLKNSCMLYRFRLKPYHE